MNTFLYIVIGFAIGFEVGKMASGQKYDWKRSIIAGAAALAIAVTIVIFVD